MKLELLLATPRATLMRLLCSPNLPRASYLIERTRDVMTLIGDESEERTSLWGC